MGMAGKAEDNFKGTLPKEFMQLGMSVYQDFDKIAADAESIKDPKHTLQQLSQSMGKCVACHATYQIRKEKISLKPVRQANHHEP
jgi:ATP phosphoribosyltransferase regulatory subunit HisZ